jgi:hypothetical protein
MAPRNDQDDYFFPLDTEASWFHREPFHTYTATMASNEIVHKGTAAWGGRLTFEIGALGSGDLLQALILQIRLGSWYDPTTILKLRTGEYTVDLSSNPWTYINSLGTAIIDYAEFEVGDQTLERLDGEFIKAYAALIPDENMIFGLATDGTGRRALSWRGVVDRDGDRSLLILALSSPIETFGDARPCYDALLDRAGIWA